LCSDDCECFLEGLLYVLAISFIWVWFYCNCIGFNGDFYNCVFLSVSYVFLLFKTKLRELLYFSIFCYVWILYFWFCLMLSDLLTEYNFRPFYDEYRLNFVSNGSLSILNYCFTFITLPYIIFFGQICSNFDEGYWFIRLLLLFVCSLYLIYYC
jgi:hypothetical protein